MREERERERERERELKREHETQNSLGTRETSFRKIQKAWFNILQTRDHQTCGAHSP
jgi:hypothetical protein